MPAITDKNSGQMQETIKNITFNPCGYTMAEIRAMWRNGEVSREQLAGVLGPEATQVILSNETPDPLPKGGAYEVGKGWMDEATQVVMWGVPQSGKTLAVASLLALDGMQVQEPESPALRQRISWMRALFDQPGTLRYIPQDADTLRETYHVAYKSGFAAKTYPITFIEATIPADGVINLSMYVNRERPQIHVFCIDCTQDIPNQVNKFMRVIGGLRKLGYLSQTDGAYALVTKTDQMNVPGAYLDNASQTLVTKGMPELWQMITDICYDNQIYNALPIPFSVGQFAVSDVARLSNRHAKEFFQSALLPKCQPRRGLVGRMLSVGRWWQAAILAVVLAGAIGWGGYKTFQMLTAPPTAPMMPYDYKATFLSDIKGLAKMDYKEASQLYQRQRKDLYVERTLHRADGEAVLGREDLRICDSTLTNDYARVLGGKCGRLLETSHWSENEGELQQLRSRLGELAEHEDVLTDRDITEYHSYIDDYFKYVKPLIRKSKNCTRIREVADVEENSRIWMKYPYNNDVDLRYDIREATRTAYERCARYYKNRVDSIVGLYPKDRVFDFSSFSYYDSNAHIRTAKLEPYSHSVDSMLRRLDGKGDAFNQARTILRAAQSTISSNW